MLIVAPRTREGRIPIAGEIVRRIRERQFAWTRLELAQKIGKSESAVQSIEAGTTPTVYHKTFRAIADAFGMSLDDAKLKLSPAKWDSNVEPFHQTHIPQPIPEFDLPIAAGGWSHVTDNHTGGITCTAEQRRQGLFRVRIRGDSMTPRFQDGDLVEFKLLCTPEGLPDFAAMREGEAYYVQKNDGEGTFKICQKIEPEMLVLVATNKRYKKPLTAPIADVVSIGRYEHVIVRR